MTTTTKTAPRRKTVQATTTRASNKQTQTKQQKKEEQRTKMNQEQMMKKKEEVAIRQLQRWSRANICMAKPSKHTVASILSPTKALPVIRVKETANVVTPTKSPASEEAAEVQRRSRQQSRARHTTTVTNDDDDDEKMATKEPHCLATTPTDVVVTSQISSSPTPKKRKLSQLSHTNNSPSRHGNVRMGLTAAVALVAMTRSSYKTFLVSNLTGTRNISTSSSTTDDTPTQDTTMTTRLREKVPSHLQTKLSSSVNDLSARSRLLFSQIGMSTLDAETLWTPTTSSETSSRKKQRMTKATAFSQTTTEHEPTTTTMTSSISRSAAVFQKMKELTESVLDDL